MKFFKNIFSYFISNDEINFNPNGKTIEEINKFIIENKKNIINSYKYEIVNKFEENKLNNKIGLENIGNTCYMNSALQCFMAILPIKKYFLSKTFLKDINIVNPISTRGKLACEYNKLLSLVYKRDLDDSEDSDYINPKNLKRIISKTSKQFSGYYQQDSQEFLSFLISNLHEDVNKILKKPYVSIPDYKNQSIIEYAELYWKIFKNRNNSIITDYIYGQYKTTINCQKCNFVSYSFDEFNQISLPLEDKINFNFYYLTYGENKNYKVSFLITKNSTFKEFLEKFSTEFNTPINELRGYLYSYTKMVKKIIDLNKEIEEINKSNYNLFIVRIWNSEIFKKELTIKEKMNEEIDNYDDEEEIKNEENVIKIIFKLNNDNEIELEREFYIKGYENNLYELIYYFLNYEKGSDIKELKSEFIKLCESDKLYFKILNDDKLLNFDDEIICNNYYSVILFKDQEYAKNKLLNFEKKSFSYNLINLLENIENYQVLDEENKWCCTKCKEFNNASIKMEIYRAPKILIIHFKRFKIFEKNNKIFIRKNDWNIKYPIEEFNWNEKIIYKENGIDYNYELFGIVIHKGTLNYGHYVSFTKNWNSNDWYFFNDEEYKKINSHQNLQNEDAYILFYKLINF